MSVFAKTLRLVGAAGVAGACSLAVAVGEPGKPVKAGGSAAASSQPAGAVKGTEAAAAAAAKAAAIKAEPVDPLLAEPPAGVDPARALFEYKEMLAARDNVPGGLRGPGPVNDLCTGARDLATLGFGSGASITVSDDNTTATADAGLPACGFRNASQSSGSVGLWYTFVGTGNMVWFATCPSTVDMTLRAFCGSCANPICVGADDDGCSAGTGGNTLGSYLGICTSPGVQYFVLISRYGTVAVGAPFSFTVTDGGTPCGAAACAAPGNDDCATAQPVAIGATVRGNTAAATPDAFTGCGQVAGQQGVWFQLTGDGSILRASTCGPNTGANSAVAVFTGGCGGLSCVASSLTTGLTCSSLRDDNASVDWTSTAGTVYLVLVSNDTNGAGEFSLAVTSIGMPATNDTCATAIPVGLPSSTAGNNFGATNEVGLPTCSGLLTWNNGVWFRFTGNGNRVSVSTCDPATQLNTRVYVFTTPDCAAFTCVAANATATPACASPATAATVTYCSQAAQDYYVLVTNDTTGTGTFQLVISDLGPIGCVPTGACCVGTSCSITTLAGCGGTYRGDNTACNPGAVSPNLTLPDFNATPTTTSSTIVVPAGGPTITDLNVSLIVNHTWQGDLGMLLTHVDTGTAVQLVNRPGVPGYSTVGFSADNYGNAGTNTPFTLDDAAAFPYTDAADGGNTAGPGINNVTGAWKPVQPLSAFNGQSISGTWRLDITDNAAGDTGTLVFWSLDSTPAAPSPCTGCPADFDHNGTVEPADIAGFVNTWFASLQNHTLDGDWDHNGAIEPADIAAFVNVWFNALTNGC